MAKGPQTAHQEHPLGIPIPREAREAPTYPYLRYYKNQTFGAVTANKSGGKQALD